MAEASASASGGIGFTGLLTVAFVVLKLTHVIDWSWWWVLSPIWISTSLGVTILAVVLVVLLVTMRKERKALKAKAAKPSVRPRNPWVG